MGAKKSEAGLLAVDPEAQKYIRDVTKPFVAEMVNILVGIARDPHAGTRDRMKSAVRIIDYHARGGSPEDVNADGTTKIGIMVVNGASTRDMDEAADELRRLQQLTLAGGTRQ